MERAMTINDIPARVLIVRHAEKPADAADPHLSETGQRRAQALARRLPVLFPWIGFLFAAAPRPTSQRPAETLSPLSELLGLPVDTRFDELHPERLVRELHDGTHVYAQGTALIAWRHDGMSSLARALGAQDAPDHWDADVYDRLWSIEYGPQGAIIFKDEPLVLLPEDAAR
jgi:broad specificity phosphatase PhoE